MDFPFVDVILVVATAAVLCGGLVFSIRSIRASAARGTGAAAAGAENDGHVAADGVHAAVSRRDQASTELLKRFFDGKECAICKRPIPPVTRTGLKPGLLDRTTREIRSWDEIPTVNLSSALENQLAVCPECQVAESFRRRFADRVVDRDRPLQDAH